jgi:hypothetical protein
MMTVVEKLFIDAGEHVNTIRQRRNDLQSMKLQDDLDDDEEEPEDDDYDEEEDYDE